MYNPAWEAIKDLQHDAAFVEAHFELVGREIPEDHGLVLYQELLSAAPWLRDVEGLGIHPVQGAPSGRDNTQVINRRARLILRIPKDLQARASELVGMALHTAPGNIRIGALKIKPLTPFAYLYAHFVHFGTDIEADFLADARAALDKMGIRCGLIPGKLRKMRGPEGEVRGYSLMLHDLDLLQSIKIQETGLGDLRQLGCGVFIPHKSIKEVVTD